MMFIATVSAYDSMGVVHVTSNVYLTEQPSTSPVERVYTSTVTVQGVGESDPRRWLRDALVALAEAQ